MWSRYTFVCDPDECDALVEFTARDDFGFPLGVVEMKCPCGRMLNYISYEEAPWSKTLRNYKNKWDSMMTMTQMSIRI